MSDKHALTTGEVAKYCGVNFRTVIRWIERGHLEAYKLPGRGDNRVPIPAFIRFLDANHMPIPEALVQPQAVLLLLLDSAALQSELAVIGRCAGWETLVASDPMHFGYLLGSRDPAGIILAGDEYIDVVDRLSGANSHTHLLKLRLCYQDKVEKMCAGWHIVNWPEEHRALTSLLARASPAGSTGES